MFSRKLEKLLRGNASLLPGFVLLLVISLAVGVSYSRKYFQRQATRRYLQEVKDRKNTQEFLDQLVQYNANDIVWEDEALKRQFSDNHTDLHEPQYVWNYKNENVEVSGSIQDQYTGDADWERSIDHKQFDVDGDGVAEDLVLFNTAMNHRPHGLHIYKNSRRIFTLDNIVGGNVLQSKTGKGFFVGTAYYDEGDSFRGYCCPNGTAYAYFVLRDGTFTPLWEAEIPAQDSESSE